MSNYEKKEVIEKFVKDFEFLVDQLTNVSHSLKMEGRTGELREEALKILKLKSTAAWAELNDPDGNIKKVVRVKRLLRNNSDEEEME